MDSYISHNNLKIKCNIQIHQIYHLSVSEQTGKHASVKLSAGIEADSLEITGQELNSQPIKIYSTKNDLEKLIFSGVIGRVVIEKSSSYDIITIEAYSLTWFMDLEKRCRSFQGMAGGSVMDLIKQTAEEHNFQMICSGDDESIRNPFIQYMETDWEFLLRMSTHLHAPVIAASDFEGRGIYIGFQENSIPIELNASKEIWRMDEKQGYTANQRNRSGAYYEVITNRIMHPGLSVIYKNERLWVYQSTTELKNGVLQCTCQLAKKDYHLFATAYNHHIKGISLAGTVLERSGETIKIHLDIDEEQETEKAFPYVWLPDYGNMLYCMPETGSRIRLLFPDEDERNAIGIHCIRQNGQACDKTQNPAHRWFATDNDKTFTMQPSLIGIETDNQSTSILLQDDAGSIIKSSREVLIQAAGHVHLQGSKIDITAPAEVTAIKRQLGSPAVVNLCHNLDATGRYSTFKNLEELKTQTVLKKAKSPKSGRIVVNKKRQEAEEKEKEKLNFKLKELMEDDNTGKTYEFGASIVNIISAIPQNIEQDNISQITMGFRPITGRMKGD